MSGSPPRNAQANHNLTLFGSSLAGGLCASSLGHDLRAGNRTSHEAPHETTDARRALLAQLWIELGSSGSIGEAQNLHANNGARVHCGCGDLADLRSETFHLG